MTQIWSIALKELRGYFHSAVAFIFLGAFLAAVLFTFFWVDKFFARGVADVRPLFEWLPVLLIFLVAALTMRLWSEEQKGGTIELLLTLPVPIHRLVLGKFVAGLLLIALALALTLGLPITVSMMGDLDWGPVIGGYFAALLLASAYLSIGLCVSSATENQIVSLVVTTLVCAALYLPGMAAVSGGEGHTAVAFLHAIGTGTRFESVARGVVDLRDLAYWGGLITFGLFLNMTLLAAKRWSAGRRTRARRMATIAMTALIGANMIALSVWLAPFARARVDLTEDGIYKLSDVSENLLSSLDEPLLIRGYFSEKSHPLLTPLVPQIRDLLEEYRIGGGDDVRVEFVDPTDDPAVEDEALEQYGISSVPFEFSDHREKSVVNAYFHILIVYGDQHIVVGFDDLIEVRPGPDVGDVDVKLRNLEYDLTRAIKKVAYGFKSVDLVLESLTENAELVFLVTPETVPESLKEAVPTIEKAARDLEQRSSGKLTFVTESPKLSREAMLAVYQQYGVKPSMSILGDDAHYFHLVLSVGDKRELVVIKGELSDAAVKTAIDTALRRVSPGFVRRIGVYIPPAPPPDPPSQMNPQPQQKRPPQMYQQLGQSISQNYEIRHAPLSGPVADDIDVLIVAGPENLGETQQKAIDQFLMRGGAVIILAGRYRLDTSLRSLAVQSIATGLEDMLDTYGFEIQGKLIVDPESSKFRVPVVETLPGGRRRESYRFVPYPFFMHATRGQMAEGHVVTSSLSSATLHWASPVIFAAKSDGEVQHDVLVSSSSGAWLQVNTNVTPDYRLFPDDGFGRPDNVADADRGPHPVVIAATGTFNSHFVPKDPSGQLGARPQGDAKPDSAGAERILEASPPDARLVVIGSSGFVSDELLQLGNRDEFVSNLQLVENLIDWAIEDVDLLSIRARGTHMRRLELDDDGESKWEFINYALIAIGLGLVIGVSTVRRKTLVAIALDRDSADDDHHEGDEDDDGDRDREEEEE